MKFFKIMLALTFFVLLPHQVILAEKTKEKRHLTGFNQIKLNDRGTLYLTQGDKESVVIECNSDDMDRIDVHVKGNALILEQDKGFFGRSVDVVYHVTFKDLEKVKISGSGSLNSDRIHVDNIYFGISGSGDVRIDDLEAESIELKISGSGEANLSGEASHQKITISGSGDVFSEKLMGENVTINISGSGKARIFASEELNIRASGSGKVIYFGDPRVQTTSSGSFSAIPGRK